MIGCLEEDAMSAGELSSSQADYVEAIFQIRGEKGGVRAKDVADRLRVRRPSVTAALKALSASGYAVHEPYGVITLTTRGECVAREMVRRHEALQEFLVSILGIGVLEAGPAACALEHSVSKGATDRLLALMSFLKNQPGVMKQWKKHKSTC
jgi:DtxR family Mn-dependent transcriptional regulator